MQPLKLKHSRPASQIEAHARTKAGKTTSPSKGPLDGNRELRRSIGSALGKQRPSDARHIVGEPWGHGECRSVPMSRANAALVRSRPRVGIGWRTAVLWGQICLPGLALCSEFTMCEARA